MDSVFNLSVIIAAIDHLTGPVRRMASQMGDLDRVAGRGAAMRDWGTRASVAGALVEGAAGKMTRAIRGPIEIAAEFQEAMSLVGAVTKDITGEQLEALRKQALALGASTTFSATQAAEGMGFLAKAGFDAAAQMAAMPSMLDLARAGAVDLGRTADIASNILSGFGLDAAQMTRVADVMVAVFTTANTDIPMLGDTMKYIAPLARAAGLSLEEAAAMAGLLGNAGIQGSEAGTALRAMLQRLAAPTGEAAKLLRSLGVSIADEKGDLRNMVTLLNEVGAAVEGLGTQKQLEAIGTIFGAEAAAGAAELLSKGKKIGDYVAEVTKSQGRAADVAKKMADNFRGAQTEFSSAVETLSISLGTILLPRLTELALWGAKAASGLNEWVAAHPELAKTGMIVAGLAAAVIAVVAPIMAVVGAFATMVGAGFGAFAKIGLAVVWLAPKFLAAVTAIRVFAAGLWLAAGNLPFLMVRLALMGALLQGRLVAAFRMAAVAARAFGLALLTNPIGLAVAAIVAGALLVWRYWEPISGFFKDLWARVQRAFEGFSNWVSGWWERMSSGARRGFDWMAAIPRLVWGDFVAALTWENFVSALDWVSWILPIRWLDFIPGFSWSAILGGALDWGRWILALNWSDFIPGFSWSGVLGSIAALDWGALIPDLDWRRFIPTMPDVDWSSLVDAMRTPFDLAFAGISSVWDGLKSLLAWSPIATITEAFGPIADHLAGILSGAVGVASGAWERLRGIFSRGDVIEIAAGDPASVERATRASDELRVAMEAVAAVDVGASVAAVNALAAEAAETMAQISGMEAAMGRAVQLGARALARASFYDEGVALAGTLGDGLASQDFRSHGVSLMRTLAAGIRAGASDAVAAVRETVQAMRDHLPHSPAKIGPLSDLHRVRFAETLAEAVRPAPAVAAVERLAAEMAAALRAPLAAPMVGSERLPVMQAARSLPQVGFSSSREGLRSPAAGSSDSAAGGKIEIHFAPSLSFAAGFGGDEVQTREAVMKALREMGYELAQILGDEAARRQRLEY
ncbi:phage tail tape measure protein [Neomegalonema sp.]|uniref:phage tail tape measure protein n=1 Tax=Neomegalonema sp. TaxID=2039713 RepID=UPI00263777F7|nr:phage tail tape measure protein [Neomegalonema sp.]MDD2870080.1 phage tail tape measure protein [Neomegalonema sp.]